MKTKNSPAPLFEKRGVPMLSIKALSETGEIEGYGSTFGGEPDAYGDVIAAGAFTESLAGHKAAGTMPKMLWQHDRHEPVGKWLEAAEDDRGLLLKGKLNLNVEKGRRAYEHLKAGDIEGLSIGYRVKVYSVDEDTDVWTLLKIDLREVSVVTEGANASATVHGIKAARAAHEAIEKLKAGDLPSMREFEACLKGTLGLSNSQAERAARLLLKGPGEPAAAASDVREFLRALEE